MLKNKPAVKLIDENKMHDVHHAFAPVKHKMIRVIAMRSTKERKVVEIPFNSDEGKKILAIIGYK